MALNSRASRTAGGSTSSATVVLKQIDSTFYKKGAKDTIYLVLNGTDTIYESEGGPYPEQCYSNLYGTYITDYVSYTNRHRVGLGRTYRGQSIACSNWYGTTTLIYAHKTDGSVYGTPDYSKFTALSEVTYNGSTAIYPNPASASFQVRLPQTPICLNVLELYDACGRMVRSEFITKTTTTLNRDNLNTGVYFWQLKQNEEVIVRGKFILQ